MKNILFLLILFIIEICIIFIAWYFGRIISYNLNYRDMVKQTIIENVKENCIK